MPNIFWRPAQVKSIEARCPMTKILHIFKKDQDLKSESLEMVRKWSAGNVLTAGANERLMKVLFIEEKGEIMLKPKRTVHYFTWADILVMVTFKFTLLGSRCRLIQILAKGDVASDDESHSRSSASCDACLLHAVLIRASISINSEWVRLYAVNITTQPPPLRSHGAASSPVLSEEVRGHAAPFIW